VTDSERSSQATVGAARADRDRTLGAIRDLEVALGRAAGGEDWITEIGSSLRAHSEAMSEEQRELQRPDSLLTMISAERPRRFGPRVRGIKEQYADIARQLGSFRRELEASGDVTDSGELRHRAGWIIRALHNCRNRQADLVFEALGVDLGD
jgi:uncharacterized protein with von Willebrand factor type A (vWA) domain